MSFFTFMKSACPSCEAALEVEVVGSVNADRRPDLRQQIIDNTFQVVTCKACGVRFRIPPSFTYLDFARQQWILAHPAFELEDWRAFEQQARDVFETAYGAAAPEAAQELSRDMSPRITFGWPALREKLVCIELGLNDATLELLKIALLRNVQNAPFGDTVELRLLEADGDDLLFGWIAGATELLLNSLRVPRSLYADIAADTAAWAALRLELASHALVDVACLLVA